MSRKPSLILGFVLALATLLTAFALLAEDGAVREATVNVPRETQIPLDITYQGATFFAVESHNDPQAKDVKDAEAKDPKDKTFILLRFRYKNADYARHKVKLRAVLLTADDAVVSEGGRAGTLDPKQHEDTISFPMKVKTLDWPKAAKLKITATFLN